MPVTIDRPQIGSQKEAKLRGLLAFDGHGVKKWIAALPQTSGAGSPYCSDDATVCVVQQGSNWSQVALLEVTARTGELIVLAEGVYLNTDATQGPVGTESFVVKNGRFETLWARYESGRPSVADQQHWEGPPDFVVCGCDRPLGCRWG